MSAIFGRSKQPQKPAATGLELQTSTNAIPVPLVWGRGRIAPNIIWYDGFKSRKVKVGGGKGGPSQKAWKYSVSVILGVCEGPINDINNVWRDLYFKENGSSFKTKNSAVEYLGSYSQTAWPYLTTNFPDAALNYRGVAYLGLPNYDLGDSPSMPQHSVEVNGLLYNTAINNTSVDADPALMIQDFLTNPYYGTPFRSSALDLGSLLSGPNATTTGDSAYQTYCRAMGFGLSPELSDQEAAQSILDRWLMLTNSKPVWSGSKLKIVALGDEVITANGVTYVPDTAVRYDLTLDDFQYKSGEDPVRFNRTDTSEAKNAIYLNVSDRTDDYAIKPVGAKDQASIEAFGKLQADTIEADEIKSLSMGVTLAHLILQRMSYVRNTYSFQLDQRFIRLEAMDVVTITVPNLGLQQYRVRITRIEENEDGQLDVEAEDFPEGMGSTSEYTSQTNENTPVNSNQDPGDVEPPVIFEAPSILTNGNPEVWITVTGVAEYWGGCEIHLSTDGVDYYLIGEVQNEARMGELSAALPSFVPPNPDNSNTLSVDLTISKGELESGTAADAANGVTLCYVNGELVSYEDATLTAQYEYDLTTLYRGLYGSTIASHNAGDQFARLDDTVFKYALPQEYVGETLYLKFVSFNIWGTSLQDISTLTPYTLTPTGVAWTLDPPSSVTLTPIATTLPDGSTSIALEVSWPSSPSQLIDRYDVQVTVDGSGTWVNAPSAPGDTLETQFNNALANTDYKARVRAVRTSGQAITSAWAESSVVNSGGTSTSAPNPATSVTAVDSVGGISVKWTGSSSASVVGYKIYGVNNHTGAFGDATLIGTVSRGTSEYFHAGLSGGSLWRYWVVAYNGSGDAAPAGPANGEALSAGGSVEVQEDGVTVVGAASILNFTGSGVTLTDEGSGEVTINIPGGGGGNGWEEVFTWSFSTDGTLATPVTIPNLADYEDLRIVFIATTKSASQAFTLQMSQDNGSTFFTSTGDYVAFSTGAVTTRSDLTLPGGATTNARTNATEITGLKKYPSVITPALNTGQPSQMFVANGNPVNAIRILAGGASLTGGELHVFARKGGGGIGFSGAVATLSSTSTVTFPVLPVLYNQEEYDVGGWFDPSTPGRMVIPSGVSYVEVVAGVALTTAAATGTIFMDVYKNGSVIPYGTGINSVRNGSSGFNNNIASIVTPPISVVPGDYLEIRVNCSISGVTQVLSNRSTFFGIKAIG